MSSPTVPASPEGPLSPRQRLISLAEITLGTFIVIGHNLLHFLPNEVPIQLVFFWVSFRLREGLWRVPALRRPRLWWKTVLRAVSGATLYSGLLRGSLYFFRDATCGPRSRRTDSAIRSMCS